MSKKIFNVFFVVLFLSSFCFIGCTDLLAPKAQTDINLNIDLSKIIKSSRNEGASQGASSLGDNPTIKVAIYDAKDYDKATNSTENLTLITQAQASVGGDGIARVKLSDIPVGIDAIVFAELSFTDENSTQVVYAGNSGVFKVKASDNKVSLVLKKVANSETSPDNTNTPYENYTLYKKTENGEEVSNVTGATISTSSTSETKVTVTNPDSSDSVWTYFVKPENKTRFTKSGNYKVSVELKADKTTVVGIAAARADYFFTVNSDWTTCEFNTGYLIGNENHQFTIGLGLSSEIQIKNLKIEKLSEIDTTEPSLVFDISKNSIKTYLGKIDKATKIIEVSKNSTERSYNITINAPLSHSATVQDVKLHLRSYATENTGANSVSFNITNTGSNDFETSVMADTANEKSIAWNNGTQQITSGALCSYEIDFPNYVANDELIVDVITSSEDAITEPIKLKISEFAVTKGFSAPFANKIFAIQIDEDWTKIDDGAPVSKEFKISNNTSVNFDVGLFNGFNDEDATPSDFDDVTRFLYKGKNLPTGLSYREEAGPKFIITNNSDSDKIVKISLNENYEVVIEEVVSSWSALKSNIESLTSTTPTEIYITENLVASSEINISAPVKLIANNNVTISRGGIFTGNFFNVSSGGSLEITGSGNSTITLDGGNSGSNPITAQSPLITVNSDGKLTLSNCTLQNNNSSGYGGAVYVNGGTLNFSSGTITYCNAKDGGGVYITNGGSFEMTGGTIQNCEASLSGGGVWMKNGCSFEMSDGYISSCTATSEGGGVFITADNGKDPSSFTMNGGTITGCTAQNYGGGGVSYGCGTNDSNIKFTMNGGTISECSSSDGGGVYLYGCFEMNGGTISGNTASNGAGVYVRDNSSSFTMNRGTISDNKATVKGGGVYLSHSSSSFTMNGGVIGKEITEGTEGTKQSWQYAATGDEGKHSNYAGAGGGGIYVEDGNVTINGGKISYNYVPNLASDCGGNAPSDTACGGGISVVKGNLTINNAEVSYNSGYQGGGIRCYNDNTSNDCTLTLNGTLIKGNTSNPYKGSSFGGGLMVKNFNVNFGTTKSTIEQNFSGDGGAVFIEDTTVTLNNITIQNNKYATDGYRYGSEVLLWDKANVSINESPDNVKIASFEGETQGICIHADSNGQTNALNLSGDAKLDAPIYLVENTKITITGALTADNVATITLDGTFTESTPVLQAGVGVTLAEQVGKFALTRSADGTEYKIDSNGKLAPVSQNYAQGLTYQKVSGSDTLYISSPEGLAYFRDIVNGSLSSEITVQGKDNGNAKTFTANTSVSDVNAVLENDITIYDEWTPIGKYANDNTKKPYSGTFDGDRKTVTFDNITHSDTSMYSSGLFQMVSGTVKNLVIDGYISRTATGYIGGVVGYLDGGTIEYCVNKAKISNVAANGTGGIVGVIGNTGSSLVGCVNMGYISSENSSVGGIVGGSTGTASNISISKCINVGKVTASYTVAGIYGNLSSNQSGFTLSDCINLGNIYMTGTSSSTVYMAGIINNTPSCTVSNCLSVGLLQNNGSSFSVIGAISSTPSGYTNCYFNTEVISSPTDQGTPGNNGKTTAELCALTTSDLSNWSCVTDNTRYPLPALEEYLPTGSDVEQSIWDEIVAAATPEDIGGGTGGGTTSTYSIGEVYYQNNTPMGVVFQVAEDNSYIKIVALEDLSYDPIKLVKYTSWIDESTYPNAYDHYEGSLNSDAYRDFDESLSSFNSYNSESDLPAFYQSWNYYVDVAEDYTKTMETFTWYIPAIEELKIIVNDTEGKISDALSDFEVLYNQGIYWSSTLVFQDTSRSDIGYCIGEKSNGVLEHNVSTDHYVRLVKKVTF